jgi:hypothetical protein
MGNSSDPLDDYVLATIMANQQRPVDALQTPLDRGWAGVV